MQGMRVRDFLRAKKTVTKAGSWKDGKMPRTAFPLVGTRSLRLSGGWEWRVDQIEGANSSDCRLLIAIREDVEACQAYLSIRRGSDYAVIARLEYHATHPGWHCHAECGSVDDVPVGVIQTSRLRRLPNARAYHRRRAQVTRLDVLNVVYSVLRVSERTGELGL